MWLPSRLAKRRIETSTSLRRRPKARTYASTSAASLPNPYFGGVREGTSSRKLTGSVCSEPYTAVDDLRTKRRTLGAFWQAAKSCIAPMTLISFMRARPPAARGVDAVLRWSTVSISEASITRDTSGLRTSARTNSVRRRSAWGSRTSTPMISRTSSRCSRARATRPASWPATPVMSTRRPSVTKRS